MNIRRFIKQVKIYFKLMANYKKMARKKSLYFYIYSMPPIGFFLYYFFLKLILKTKSKKIINTIFQYKIFKCTIRFLNINEWNFLANNLTEYNYLKEINYDDYTKEKVLQLKRNGYCSLGKIFSDDECENFTKFLSNKKCYNSNVPLRSNMIPMYFNNNFFKEDYGKYPYIVFLPEIIDYEPVQKLLNKEEIQKIANSFLKFDWTIYSCITWFNPITNNWDYIHDLHRDYEDFKTLTMIIYWTDVSKTSGCFMYVKESHKSNKKENEKIFFNGKKGEVFLVDTSGLHGAKPVKENPRITTQIRFGKPDGYSSVLDGFCQTPTPEQLSFLKRF